MSRTRSYTNTLNAALQELSSASLIQEFGCRALPSITLPRSCAPFREAPLIFREFLDRSETRVVKLIEQGNDLNGKLMRFGERLTAMAAFAAGEMRALHGEENTVKNAIWTWLGGNRGLLEEYQRNIVSLERFSVTIHWRIVVCRRPRGLSKKFSPPYRSFALSRPIRRLVHPASKCAR